MLKPNRFGRYIKREILDNGYCILEAGMTATEIKELTGIELTHEQRLKHCMGFVCKKEWRGCVPVFDVFTIQQKYEDGLL